jgi:hypothetical protein
MSLLAAVVIFAAALATSAPLARTQEDTAAPVPATAPSGDAPGSAGGGILTRLALVDVLIVLGPNALACWVLPQTEKWAHAWTRALVATPGCLSSNPS